MMEDCRDILDFPGFDFGQLSEGKKGGARREDLTDMGKEISVFWALVQVCQKDGIRWEDASNLVNALLIAEIIDQILDHMVQDILGNPRMSALE